ncbi:autophagy-related protein 16-like isoform X1 [Bolinopsis microptera]|uniref:autophagy-related protein 16-like isoform X1 n=1 Tax=Bolinopsis microptera TaxID=2820187 RepID=UPI003079EE8C
MGESSKRKQPKTWEIVISGTWPKQFVEKLRERNNRETAPYEDIFNSFASLYSTLEQYRGKIKKLDYENLRRQEDIKSIINDPGKKLTENDKNFLSLQQENIQLIRQHENTQREMLRMAMKVKDVGSKETQIINLDGKCFRLEQENGVLRDEFTTLQLMCRKLEEDNKNLLMENQHMLEKILLHKKEEADVVNMHNDTMKKLKEHQMFYELESARKEDNNSPEQSLGGISNSGAGGRAGLFSRLFRKSESESEDHESRHSSVSSRCRLYSGPAIIPSQVTNKVEQHSSELYSLAFSYQGTMFATGGADKCVKLWRSSNLPNVDSISTLTGCNAGVMSIDIDERDQYVVAGSNDSAVRMWQVAGGQIRSTFMGHDNKIYCVKFYSHSQKIVSGSHDRTLRLWDVRTNKNVRTIFARSSCHDLAVLSEQGTDIVSGHFDKRLRFWDERQDTSSFEMLLDGRITSLDLSGCGKYLACSCKDASTIKFIDLKLRQAIATFTADGLRMGEHTRCSFSPDGQYIACGSTDGNIFVWNTRTLKREEVPKMHSSAVPVVKWHPMGQAFISLEKSKKFYVWSDLS